MTNDDIDYDRLRDDELNEPRRLSPTVRDLPSVLGDGRAMIATTRDNRLWPETLRSVLGDGRALIIPCGLRWLLVSHFDLLQLVAGLSVSGRFRAAGACSLLCSLV